MDLVDGEHAAERLENIVHADTQVSTDGVDLTVAEIFEFSSRGSLNFGGGRNVVGVYTLRRYDFGWNAVDDVVVTPLK